jgi:hypothetical protein
LPLPFSSAFSASMRMPSRMARYDAASACHAGTDVVIVT